MKSFVLGFLGLLLSLSLFIAAGIMAYNKIGGWGWFLFVGVITVPNITIKWKNSKKKKKNPEEIPKNEQP